MTIPKEHTSPKLDTPKVDIERLGIGHGDASTTDSPNPTQKSTEGRRDRDPDSTSQKIGRLFSYTQPQKLTDNKSTTKTRTDQTLSGTAPTAPAAWQQSGAAAVNPYLLAAAGGGANLGKLPSLGGNSSRAQGTGGNRGDSHGGLRQPPPGNHNRGYNDRGGTGNANNLANEIRRSNESNSNKTQNTIIPDYNEIALDASHIRLKFNAVFADQGLSLEPERGFENLRHTVLVAGSQDNLSQSKQDLVERISARGYNIAFVDPDSGTGKQLIDTINQEHITGKTANGTKTTFKFDTKFGQDGNDFALISTYIKSDSVKLESAIHQPRNEQEIDDQTKIFHEFFAPRAKDDEEPITIEINKSDED